MYNLRSEGRKRKQYPCYLRDYLAAKSSENISPKVCLTRSEILDKYNKNSFYIKDDQIIPIPRNKENYNYEKICWKIICLIILIIVSFICWREDFSQYGISVLSKKALLNYTFQNYYFKALKFINSDLVNGNIVDMKNDKSVKPYRIMPEPSNENYIDPTEIKNLVKQYLLLQKRKKNNLESHSSFVKEQCWKGSHLKDNIFFSTPKVETHDSDYRPSVMDYALESQGATIVSVYGTKPYGIITLKIWNYDIAALLNYFTQQFIVFNGPTSILQPWKEPGDCWAFKGSHGRIEIKLSKKIVIYAIAMEHIPKDRIPNGIINSAPKKFSIVGLEETGNQNSKTYLGAYEYNLLGSSRQIFKIEPLVVKIFEAVEVTINSNHGNKDYTCIYKIGVYSHIQNHL